MRVEIIRNVMINGESVKAGSFVEVDHVLATLLLNSDKAQVAKEPEPAPACPPKAAPVNPPKAQSTRRGRAKASSGED
jgi:pyruvate/2-oxoglutarate dehydrogenase complex dihydrolipoamide acyltransferase (E2) component